MEELSLGTTGNGLGSGSGAAAVCPSALTHSLNFSDLWFLGLKMACSEDYTK